MFVMEVLLVGDEVGVSLLDNDCNDVSISTNTSDVSNMAKYVA